jgi:hypothetical protein
VLAFGGNLEDGLSAWVDQIFEPQHAGSGGVVRRSRDDVEKYASLNELVEGARRRRFHVIETGGQVVILCE